MKKFNIDVQTSNFDTYYTNALKEFDANGTDIMNFEKYNIFTYMKDDLAKIRDYALDDPDNLLYCYFLAEAIKADDKASISAISKPKKQLKSELYDTLPLFGLLYCVPDMIDEHKKRGIPHEITKATCDMFENQVQDFIDLNHRYGIAPYSAWMNDFIHCRIIRVGRFNFEVTKYACKYDIFARDDKLAVMPKSVVFHSSGNVLGSAGYEDENGSFIANMHEADEYYEGCLIENGVCKKESVRLYKSEWTRVLTQGDDIISIHIPSGGPMSADVCDRDFTLANDVISRCIAKPKAFFCCSWLLDNQLEAVIGKPTNITRFGDRFERFPIKDNGNSVFEYVFLTSPATPVHELPESNSLTKAIKSHLQNSGHIYEMCGVFLV